VIFIKKSILMATKVTPEIESMFRQFRSLCGAPIRPVQLTDDQLCDILDIAKGDYAEKVQNWLIEQNWAGLYGKNVTNLDFAYALSVRSLDMSKSFSYWFSKQVGLQQNGPWEMKKDFITIEKGKQDYIIPAGREVNRVMYVNPPTSQAALFANYAGIDIGFGGGYAQLGGGTYGPVGGFFTAPAADVAYLATDLQYKNRLLRGDLVYNMTAGPDGTHILHLLSTPGSKLTFNYMGGYGGMLGLVGCQVWYSYYDATAENADECRLANPDVIISPDQIPLADLDFAFLNGPTKTIIRQLFIAKAKETLGNVRGTFSGKVMIQQAELTMDYNMFITQGQKEYDKTMETLEKRLERMMPWTHLENQRKMLEQTLELQKGTPLGIFMI
jgi:hypothetical protein